MVERVDKKNMAELAGFADKSLFNVYHMHGSVEGDTF